MKPSPGVRDIKLANILNPTENCASTGGITISTYTDEEFKFLESRTTLAPSLSCQGLCLGCLADDKNYCTVCRDNLFLSNGPCSEQCPPQTYLDEASN